MMKKLIALILLGLSTSTFAYNGVDLLMTMSETDCHHYEQRIELAKQHENTPLQNGVYVSRMDNSLTHKVSEIKIVENHITMSVSYFNDSELTVLTNRHTVSGEFSLNHSVLHFDTVTSGDCYLTKSKSLIVHVKNNNLLIEDLYSENTTEFFKLA